MSMQANPVYRTIDDALRFGLRRFPPRYAETLALWWGYRFQPAPGVINLRSGVKLRTTHVDHLQLLLYYTGTFEDHCLQTMKRHLRPGFTVLDVGANIGLFTVEAAKAVGPDGKVLSIEALPSHAETVRAAAALNGFSNVTVFNVAAGRKDGDAVLTLPANSNFGSYTLGSVIGTETVNIPVRRIDDVLDGQRVDFIKMDIEGSELDALKGAVKTLASKPTLLIELNDPALNSCGASSKEVKQLLRDHGYIGRDVLTGRPVDFDQYHHCDECLFT
jgi:FkbM family methyltransferase